MLIATALYGGRLVFDHAAGIPTDVLTSELRERAEGHQHAPGEEHGDEAHEHEHEDEPAAAPAAGDSGTAPASPAGSDHVDPPGAPAHKH